MPRAQVIILIPILLVCCTVVLYSTTNKRRTHHLQQEDKPVYAISEDSTEYTSKPDDVENDFKEYAFKQADVESENQYGTVDYRFNRKIQRSGENQHEFWLKGSLVDERGAFMNFTHLLKSEFIFSFSPATEEAFREKMVEPIPEEQKVFANSPAIIWDNGSYLVIMRIWLDKEITKESSVNIFSDNYFYTRRYSQDMEPLDNHGGDVLGMPTRVHQGVGDGPIEPRLFDFYGKVFVSFNSALYPQKTSKMVDTTIFWSMEDMKAVFPNIVGEPNLARRQNSAILRDKHWSPYTYNNTLYFITLLDPLKVLTCDSSAACHMFANHAGKDYAFEDGRDCLRGGTPTVHYKDNYFLMVSHVTLFRRSEDKKLNWKRVYTVNMLAMRVNVEGNHQVVYISAPIELDPSKMDSIPQVRSKYIKDNFLFPVSLLLEDEDSIVIGGHVNDHSSYLVRVTGIRKIMHGLMNNDKKILLKPSHPGVLRGLARKYANDHYGYDFFGDS